MIKYNINITPPPALYRDKIIQDSENVSLYELADRSGSVLIIYAVNISNRRYFLEIL